MILGDTMTGTAAVMVMASEQLVSVIDHADRAMACRNGSDANFIAMVCA